jgi:hypothetical protein
MISNRDRLPNGQSYPIKASELERALWDAEIANVAGLQWIKRGTSIYQRVDSEGLTAAGIRADYDGVDSPRLVQHPHAPGHVWLRIYSVPSSERHEAEALVRSDALPLLIAWLRKAETETATWRSEEHQYRLFFVNGQIRQSESGELAY